MYRLVEDGKLIRRELPADVKKQLHRAGITDPFVCDRFDQRKGEGEAECL